MKRIILFFGVLCFVFATLALAQTPAPSGVPVAASLAAAVPASPGFLSGAWAFLKGPGGALLFAALYSVSELMANCFPSLAANSFFQLVTMGLKKAEAQNPAPPSA